MRVATQVATATASPQIERPSEERAAFLVQRLTSPRGGRAGGNRSSAPACERPTQKSGIRSKTGVARLPKVQRVSTMTEKCCKCNKFGQIGLWWTERVGVLFLRTVPSPQIAGSSEPPNRPEGRVQRKRRLAVSERAGRLRKRLISAAETGARDPLARRRVGDIAHSPSRGMLRRDSFRAPAAGRFAAALPSEGAARRSSRLGRCLRSAECARPSPYR